MQWILGMITYIGWGSGDIFGVYASRKIGAYKATALVYIFGFLAATLYVPFALSDLKKLTFGLVLLNIFLGTAYMGGNLLLNEAFKRSNASLVGIVVQSFPAVVLLLSTLIFKDAITLRQIVWVLVIFFGVFLCTINFTDLKKGHTLKDSGLRLALIAAGIFSIYFSFFRIFADQYGWFWANYISFSTFPIVLFLGRRFFKIKDTIKLPKSHLVLGATFMSAILLRGADIALNLGLTSGNSSIVAPLAGAAPTLFVTLSSFIYKDPVSSQQRIGIVVCLAGLLLLSFFP